MSTGGRPPTRTELDGLTAVGQFLRALAEEVPRPGNELSQETLYFALLSARAVTLYENLVHSLSSPAPLGPILAVRPLIELAILSKWISLDPDLHGELWMADSEASELTQIRFATEHMKARGNRNDPPDPEALALKGAIRSEAKKRLTDAGRNYGTRLIPSVIRMVEEVEVAIPGHKIAMRDAYDLAYRTFSPWEHTDASSYKASATRTGPDRFEYHGDRSPFRVDHLHAIGASMLAYTLEVALTQIESRHASVARRVRDYITLHWVPAGHPPQPGTPKRGFLPASRPTRRK